MTDYGRATEAKVSEIVSTCKRYGDSSIIALAGVPGTGKSYTASIAAQRFTGEPLLVREIQFHQSFSYEEFVEGLRISDETSGVDAVPGVFLEWNQRALEDEERQYVLLIEELSRANLPSVLGELLTYLEHRERPFLTMYSRKPVFIARNLTILATYNPSDRSAIELDGALIRRLRIISCPPDTGQLRDMLSGRGLSESLLQKLVAVFDGCRANFPSDYEHLMPFGHGIFADVRDEVPDLNQLWEERIRHMLRRPLVQPHAYTDLIEELYPWRDASFRIDD